jgi:MoxR-like ATPase
MTDDAARMIRDFQDTFAAVRAEVGKRIVGHAEAVDLILTTFFAGGHVLIEGVPGIGKTLLVRSLAEALGLRFGRVQFTVDLMPADIVGTRIVEEGTDGRRAFTFVPGPIFTHVLLADEVNRATPKTQAALLEAMAEQQVTVATVTHELPRPFFVLATLNPIEMEGTYQLPEAQLDRFLFKVLLGYPTEDELVRIVGTTTTADLPVVRPVLDPEDAPARVAALRRLVREVLVEPAVERWVAQLVRLTVPGVGGIDLVDRHVAYGASPRGAQALVLGAKVLALLDGRPHATREDVARVALPALRHRLVLSLAAEASGVTPAAIVDRVLAVARRARA